MNGISLPHIENIGIPGSNWQLITEHTYLSFIREENRIHAELKQKVLYLMHAPFQDFRFQVSLKTVPFLVAILYSKQQIRLYSPNLSQELFLYNALSANTDDKPVDMESWNNFKTHVELASTLDPKTFPSIYEMRTFRHQLPNLMTDREYLQIIHGMKSLTRDMLNAIRAYHLTRFERITDKGLALTARYRIFRNHALKFIAMLPSVEHDASGHEVKRLFLETMRRMKADSEKMKRSMSGQTKREALPASFLFGISLHVLLARIIPVFLFAKMIRNGVRAVARRFIAGESIEAAVKTIKKLADTGRDVTLDQLGELVVSEQEADNYMNGVLQLIEGFSLHYKKGAKNKAGILKANVSVKASALCSHFRPEDFEDTYAKTAPRLKKILEAAKHREVFINLDAESYHYRDVIFRVYKKVILDDEALKQYPGTGVVLQAYLEDAWEHFLEILDFAKAKGTTVPVRLVKGAYWDAETIEAGAHGFPAPEFLNKPETDLFFRNLMMKIMENHPHLQLEIASHNFQDHVFAEKLREITYKNHPPIEHQCLHMTYEALSTAMSNMGWVVRNYIPIGSLLVGMAYLVRRIMENSSQVGVLTIMRSHRETLSLIDPADNLRTIKSEGILDVGPGSAMVEDDFRNVPATRMYLDSERQYMGAALQRAETNSGRSYPNSTARVNGETVAIVSSSNPGLLVGKIRFASGSDAERLVEKSHEHYKSGSWALKSWGQRCQVLIRAANIMLTKRLDLAALIVYEAGKSIVEAIADVDEAIDFINFYLREERRLMSGNPHLLNRGVVAVISPWNFPIAISCGMVTGPLAAGNSVILKSAESTPLIAQMLVDIYYEAGLDKGALIHCPGTGEEAGQVLVDHPKVAMVVFTGSREIGTMISNRVEKRHYANPIHNLTYPARAITEMGGKNAIIVTENAELDETMAGIIYSAYAHAGQKCSAASRVIVSNKIKDKLLGRLREASRDVQVGPAYEFRTLVNPIISDKEKQRILRQSAEAKHEILQKGGKVVLDRTQEPFDNFCVGPAVFEVPMEAGTDETSFTHRELFAPLIHVMGYDKLDQALELFNATDYALTGGIYSQSQDDLDYCTPRMQVGNLYVNRKITGSRVFIEPFGGFNMSGTGPKAGSKQYLRAFHMERLSFPPLDCAENRYFTEQEYPYTGDLAGLNTRTTEERLKLFYQAKAAIITDLRTNMNHRYDNYQLVNIIMQCSNWMEKNLEGFVRHEHPNRKIPGQISYADYQLAKETAVVLACNQTPYASTLLYALAAVALGTGITVFALTREAFDFWQNLQGLEEDHVKIKPLSMSQLSGLFKNPFISNVILDVPLSRESEFLKLVYHEHFNEKRLKQILSVRDAPGFKNFEAYLLAFVNIRSFAINTIRYGAPLEI